MSDSVHVPVLATEVYEWLAPQPGQVFVDGTLGGGGHTRGLLERVGPTGLVIALDRDPAAIARAEAELAGSPLKLVPANFAELDQALVAAQAGPVDGILLDIGLSSDQLADPARGFSFDSAGPLDMRFDPTDGESAAELLAHIAEDDLANLIYQNGEERLSRRIAKAIVERRRSSPIQTAAELAAVVRKAVGRRGDVDRIDPATRTFQALRIAVNRELSSLERVLEIAPAALKPGGRIAIISFHSLEDRIVKETFRDDPRYQPLTKKPIQAGPAEVARNPRARSAKLRVAARA